MTAKLLINGQDYTARWRIYESSFEMKAWQGESTTSSFVIDDWDGQVNHNDLRPRKIVEVWEDASGGDKCLYHGRIATKILGKGVQDAPAASMFWTLQVEDYNIEMRGLRVEDQTRGAETDEARFDFFRLGWLNGVASTNSNARASTILGDTYLGGGDAVNLEGEQYKDTDPVNVFSRIAESTGRLFFVYLTEDGDGELYYADRGDHALVSDISLSDEDEFADGIDTYAVYKSPQAGVHEGQNVLTGGAVRWNDSTAYFEASDVGGAEAVYDKWETTFINDYIQQEAQAEVFLEKVVTNNDEGISYSATWEMDAEHVHRVRAGQFVELVRQRANKGGNDDIRAVLVRYEPIPQQTLDTGIITHKTRYRVTAEFGRPNLVGPIPRGRLRIPRGPTQPTSECHRWYFSNSTSALDPATSALWDVDSYGSSRQLKRTADSSNSATQQSVSSAGGSGSDIRLGEHVFELNSAEAAVLAAGGATLRGQLRARSRFGIGVPDSAQDNISQITVRVFDSGGSLRGTAYAGHSLSSSAGSAKWLAQATKVNRVFPPAAASNTLSAVSGTVAGDFLVVETGYRSFTVGTTGAAVAFTNDNAADLPNDELETQPQNSYIEICSGSSGDTTEPVGGSGSGTPGTSPLYAPIDHVHEHGELSADALHHHDETQVEGTEDYVEAIRTDSDTPDINDDEDDGYRAGDVWVDRTANEVYMLTDATAGAAVWTRIDGAGISDHGGLSGLLDDDHPQYLKAFGGGEDDVQTHGAMGAAETIDPAQGNWHAGTLDANCTLTLTGPTNGKGCWIAIELLQDGTGGWEITLPASVVNKTDLEAAQDTTASATTFLSLWTRDGGTNWYGAWAGTGGGSVSSDTHFEVLLTEDGSEPLTTEDGLDWLYVEVAN